MTHICIVSNRLPFSVERGDDSLQIRGSIGGLATGLGSLYREYDCTWIGWPGIIPRGRREEEEIRALAKEKNCHPVFLTKEDLAGYYDGFCNTTIWPLFHAFKNECEWSDDHWRAYSRVNEQFSRAVGEVSDPGDVVWVHDYHLMCLPSLLRKSLPGVSIGYFNHIPFPSYETFRVFPWKKEIMEGLLGADLVGFHTYDYVRHFITSARRICGYDISGGQIMRPERTVRVDTFPMGIDYDHFASVAASEEVRRLSDEIRGEHPEQKILLSFDRLDYTKGIPRRIDAYSAFLEKYPEYHGRVVLILVAVPSRTSVRKYRRLKKEVDERVGQICGRFGTINWIPVQYLYDELPFEMLIALYTAADIALVTPESDGMNLMAKEFLACRGADGGVLVLSEMAGAAAEMGEALIINPFSGDEFVEAIKKAIVMPEEEQVRRNRILQERISRYNVRRWAHDFIHRLNEETTACRCRGESLLEGDPREKLLLSCKNAKKRLFLLDYDGTLVPFAGNPDLAVPDYPLRTLLSLLNSSGNSTAVILSGRGRNILEGWFNDCGCSLVAEHGTWVRPSGEEWMMAGSLKNDWKEDVIPVMNLFVDRTPGSSTEEKEFSLVWHYRRADPELGETRARELSDVLRDLCGSNNLTVMEGNRVVEVKCAQITKGRAAEHWLSEGGWDFVLAAGDDSTDESLFEAVPADAWTIKIGHGHSSARFHLPDYLYMRDLLEGCAFASSQPSLGDAGMNSPLIPEERRDVS